MTRLALPHPPTKEPPREGTASALDLSPPLALPAAPLWLPGLGRHMATSLTYGSIFRLTYIYIHIYIYFILFYYMVLHYITLYFILSYSILS